MDTFDVIVVGAGHAGYEAALAAARMGARVAMITMDLHAIGRMSCNPSIGGIGKSHMVIELDALGGEMARNADYTGIQFRTLNLSKGPAVQAHRVQCDKSHFQSRISAIVRNVKGVTLIEGQVADLAVRNGRLAGVRLIDDSLVAAKTVVIAGGTFVSGLIHIGKTSFPGGRMGEEAATRLGSSMSRLGFRMGRLKTGTPPRLRKDSLDYQLMEAQPGLTPPPMLSLAAKQDRRLFHVEQGDEVAVTDAVAGFLARSFHVEQLSGEMRPWSPGSAQMSCFITHTTEKTREIIQSHLSDSALYGGMIHGVGVRYCPSIEDKIVKFPHHVSHHVFVEPEGRALDEMYPNGTSNSLPEDVQLEMIRSIPGMARAEFTRPGYAIEYDYSDPTQLDHKLESKIVEGLFMAGQVNGTTGYEEAGAQGFVAGVNAAAKAMGRTPFTLQRHEAYIGVMIDDLVTKGVDEPYRMFTSRAEYRLLLRQDNARFRLLEHAKAIGIVAPEVTSETADMAAAMESELERLSRTYAGGASLMQRLCQPDSDYRLLPGARTDLEDEVVEQITVLARYAGYIERDKARAAKAAALEDVMIPDDVDFARIKAMRTEAKEKLHRIRPATLGQASRIPGLTPADIAVLSIEIYK